MIISWFQSTYICLMYIMIFVVSEYGLEGLVSTRCDVYSYGVMLMETFTRKRPSDDMFGEDLSLKRWVEVSIGETPDEVIDVKLVMNFKEVHIDKIVQWKYILTRLCDVYHPYLNWL